MSFFTPNPETIDKVNGMVYVLLIDLENTTVVKIGVTARPKIEDRVCEVLKSIYTRYRYFPYTYTKRFTQTTDIYAKEADLHYHFNNVRYTPDKPFDGSTEIFMIKDINYLVDIYARCLAGENIRELEQYKPELSIDLV
jgi:hypothetical protein